MKQISDIAPIALLSPGELFGGVETQNLSHCLYLREQNIEVIPIFFHDHELATQFRNARFNPIILSGYHRYDPTTASRLKNILIHHGVRVLHIHGYRATVTAAVANAHKYAAVVKTEHGLPEAQGFPGKIKSGINHTLDRWATRRLGASVCYVTFDIMGRYDQPHAGLQRRTIYNGIVPIDSAEHNRPEILDPTQFHIGIVGRVTNVKGITFALQAMKHCEDLDSLHLDIIGTGGLLDRLSDEANSLGLTGRVHFRGFQRNILDWMAALDVLLMPSLHEGLPYTLLEAMSLGLPIIASNVGGLAEVLRHDDTGLLVEVGDVAAMAKAMRQLYTDKATRMRLGTAASREQRTNYSLQRMGDEYVEVYQAASQYT